MFLQHYVGGLLTLDRKEKWQSLQARFKIPKLCKSDMFVVFFFSNGQRGSMKCPQKLGTKLHCIWGPNYIARCSSKHSYFQTIAKNISYEEARKMPAVEFTVTIGPALNIHVMSQTNLSGYYKARNKAAFLHFMNSRKNIFPSVFSSSSRNVHKLPSAKVHTRDLFYTQIEIKTNQMYL